MNKLNKDRVEEIIASAERVRQAEPSPFLFTRIEANLDTLLHGAAVPKVKVGLVFGTAALLIALNLGAIFSGSASKTPVQVRSDSAPSQSSSYMGLDSYNLDLY